MVAPAHFPTYWVRHAFLACLIAAVADAQNPRRPNGSRAPRAGLIQGTELVIVATDDGIEAPDQVDAGLLNMRLFNRGTGLARVTLVKIDRIERLGTIAEYLRSDHWNVPWMTPLGGPEATSGGLSSTIAMVEPGRYILVGLRDSPTLPRLNVDEGWIRELSVIKPLVNGPRVLPPTELAVNLTEWGLRLTGPLHAGRRTLRVTNGGKFEHNFWVLRLLPGHTLQEAMRFADSRRGTPPFEAMGGTSTLGAGRSVNVTLDLLPGEYALICTMFNPLSRKSHADHGMVIQVTVTN